jgi:flagellar biosynthetic protein FliR
MIGFSTGLAFAQSVDPTYGEVATPPQQALGALAIAIFFAIQGHHAALGALAESLRMLPPGDLSTRVPFESVSNVGIRLVAHGLRIAAPVVATMFLVQLGTAFASRAAPRVHVFSLTFAIAVCTGMLALFVATPSLAPALAAEIQQLPTLLREALGGL